jgi:hypothetical protein
MNKLDRFLDKYNITIFCNWDKCTGIEIISTIRLRLKPKNAVVFSAEWLKFSFCLKYWLWDLDKIGSIE